jgi:hypothetical protein
VTVFYGPVITETVVDDDAVMPYQESGVSDVFVVVAVAL